MVRIARVWAVAHPEGEFCWNSHPEVHTEKAVADRVAKEHDENRNGYGCKYGPHEVVEFARVES